MQGPLLASLMSMQAAGNLATSRPGANGMQMPYPMAGGALGPSGPVGSSQMPLGAPSGSLLNMLPSGPGQGTLAGHTSLWQPGLPGPSAWGQNTQQ